MNLIGVKSFNQSNILKLKIKKIKKKYVTKTMAKIIIQVTLQEEATAESRISSQNFWSWVADPGGRDFFLNHTYDDMRAHGLGRHMPDQDSELISDPDPLIQGDVTSSLSCFMMITGPQAGRHTPDQSSEFISDSLILIQGTWLFFYAVERSTSLLLTKYK